jgi:hypothetical protein
LLHIFFFCLLVYFNFFFSHSQWTPSSFFDLSNLILSLPFFFIWVLSNLIKLSLPHQTAYKIWFFHSWGCFIMWHGLERRRKNPAQTEITTPATVSIFGTYTDYCCGTCNQYWETTMHILHDCQVANKVWKKRFRASGTFQYHMNNIR